LFDILAIWIARKTSGEQINVMCTIAFWSTAQREAAQSPEGLSLVSFRHLPGHFDSVLIKHW
jgi:hypothetical protein